MPAKTETSFRSSLLRLILVGAVVSICLALTVVQWHRKIDREQFQLGENSLATKDLELLSSGIDQVLTLTDLVFASSETYLIDGLLDQSNQLRKATLSLSRQRLLEPSSERLGEIHRRLAQIESLTRLAGKEGNVTESGEQERLALLDELTPDIVQAIQETLLQAQNDSTLASQRLAGEKKQLHQASWVAIAFYIIFIICLFQWATQKLIRPIERLNRAARDAMDSGTQFSLSEAGPREVRKLTRSIAAFVATLEEKVSQRTRELSLKTTDLEHEVLERRSAQRDLVKSKKIAEAANRAKSDFLANVSHEIRTPMNGIVGFSKMLDETSLDAQQSEYCNTIRVCSETLLNLINDILAISKIEAGKMELDRSNFDLRECIEESFSLLEPRAREKNLEYELSLSPTVPLNALGDKIRLRQILINILSNAVKFTDKGSVACHVEAIEVGKGQNQVHFTIKDTGIGINHRNLDQIFEPFHQERPSDEQSCDGTGLGLTITRRLVTLLGGEIEVTSEMHHGSTFSFFVILDSSDRESSKVNGRSTVALCENIAPSKHLESGVPESAHDTPAKTAIAEEYPLEILVAEDNEINRRIMEHFLENMGYKPDYVVDGLEVIKAVAKKRYDLILLDIKMPHLDGIEAARRLRSNLPDQSLRPQIIAMTANAMAADRERCREVGMDGFLSKPLQPEKLESALKDCFVSLQGAGADRRFFTEYPDERRSSTALLPAGGCFGRRRPSPQQ